MTVGVLLTQFHEHGDVYFFYTEGEPDLAFNSKTEAFSTLGDEGWIPFGVTVDKFQLLDGGNACAATAKSFYFFKRS